MNIRRDHATAVGFDIHVYVFGGCNQWDENEVCTNVLASVERGNPLSTKPFWEFMADMPEGRWGHAAAVLTDTTIAIAGGQGKENLPLKSVILFDTMYGKWSFLP